MILPVIPFDATTTFYEGIQVMAQVYSPVASNSQLLYCDQVQLQMLLRVELLYGLVLTVVQTLVLCKHDRFKWNLESVYMSSIRGKFKQYQQEHTP